MVVVWWHNIACLSLSGGTLSTLAKFLNQLFSSRFPSKLDTFKHALLSSLLKSKKIPGIGMNVYPATLHRTKKDRQLCFCVFIYMRERET